MVSAVRSENGLLFQSASEVVVPLNVMLRIFLSAFEGSPQNYLTINLVSKDWRRIVTDKAIDQEFRERYAGEIFGKADFIKYIGGDPGEELPIPLEYLVQYKSGMSSLKFSPESLTFTQEDGTVVVESSSLLNIGRWALNAKAGHRIGFSQDTSKKIIRHPWKLNKTHWSYFDCKPFVWYLTGKVPGFHDIVLSLFLTYVKTGKWPISDSELWRTQELFRQGQLNVGIFPDGLYCYVEDSVFDPDYVCH